MAKLFAALATSMAMACPILPLESQVADCSAKRTDDVEDCACTLLKQTDRRGRLLTLPRETTNRELVACQTEFYKLDRPSARPVLVAPMSMMMEFQTSWWVPLDHKRRRERCSCSH